MSEQAYVVRRYAGRRCYQADGVTPWNYGRDAVNQEGSSVWLTIPFPEGPLGYERKGGTQPTDDIQMANVVLRSRRSLASYPEDEFLWVPVRIAPC